MGYDIPIFFFPIEPSIIGSDKINIEYVQNFIAENLQNPEKIKLYESNSHSWWHQNTIGEICKDSKLFGLEFLEEELICLSLNRLIDVNTALTQLISILQNGIPSKNKSQEYVGIDILRKVDFKKAFSKAAPSYIIDDKVENEFEEAVSLYVFIKSFYRAVEEAINENQCLIYYRPSP